MGISPNQPKHAIFCVRHICEHLRIACTKQFTAELMDVSGLWDLNQWTVEELLYLLVFEVLKAKDGLDRTSMKK